MLTHIIKIFIRTFYLGCVAFMLHCINVIVNYAVDVLSTTGLIKLLINYSKMNVYWLLRYSVKLFVAIGQFGVTRPNHTYGKGFGY